MLFAFPPFVTFANNKWICVCVYSNEGGSVGNICDHYKNEREGETWTVPVGNMINQSPVRPETILSHVYTTKQPVIFAITTVCAESAITTKSFLIIRQE